MSAVIISTDQTGQFAIGAGDYVVLMPEATLSIESTTDAGFLADHDGICTLTILGSVVTFGRAVAIGQNPASAMLGSVTVGATGLLQSLTDVAVEFLRSGARVDNDGTISGGNGGVGYMTGVTGGHLTNTGTIASLLGSGVAAAGAVGGATPDLFEIVNSGTIDAATDGVSIAYESLDLSNHGEIVAFGTGLLMTDDPTLDNRLTLVNTGLIQGTTAAVDATGHDDSVTNLGTLLGAVLLGEGDNTIDNSGTILGDVSGGAGADTLANNGAISGALDLGDGANQATNTGRLDNIAAGSGDDLFTNGETGSVTGTVTLGDGTNRLVNHGALGSGLTLGSGDDSLLSTGTITGTAVLGDGANAMTLQGSLHGDLFGGADVDLIEIQGRIDGDIDMGAGADQMSFGTGAQVATGRIDGGSGTDRLVTWAALEDVFDFEIIDLKGSHALDFTADAGDTTIYGSAGANEIDGGAGEDRIFGRGDDDRLFGGGGIDLIQGGRGDDALTGGVCADTLRGGTGADVFIYARDLDSRKSAPDTILDFERGRDRLDLSALSDGTISWLGTAAFTGTGEGEARYKVGAGPVDVRIDTDGDGKVDMAIVLEGLTAIDADDFYL